MRASSIDLRERIVQVSEAGGCTQEQIAERSRVSLSSVQKVLRQWRNDRSPEPKPRPGRSRAVDAAGEVKLQAAVDARPDATLAELRDACGLTCSLSSVFRALGRIDRPRKKRRSSPPSGTARTS